MHVNTERFAAHHLGMYTGRISEPVMSMYEVEIFAASQYSGNDGEVVDLLMQITWITTGKVDTSHIVQSAQMIEIGIDMVAESVIVLGRVAGHTALHLIVIHVAPCHRHLTHVHDIQETFLLARWLRHAEGSLHITLHGQAFGDTVGSHGQSAIYLWGEFPSEH